MSSIKLNNKTGNTNLGDKSIAMGQGCVSIWHEQSVFGRYPNIPTGDATSDAMIFGGGRSPNSRYTAARITKDGEFVAQGGGEVYMTSPDTGELIQVYMLGSNNRYKKVYLSK